PRLNSVRLLPTERATSGRRLPNNSTAITPTMIISCGLALINARTGMLVDIAIGLNLLTHRGLVGAKRLTKLRRGNTSAESITALEFRGCKGADGWGGVCTSRPPRVHHYRPDESHPRHIPSA